MKFADYIGMLAESVEELTFEKLKKELKAGKKFHWSNKGYTIVLDKNGDVSIVWDLGGRKENSEGLDERKFKVYSKDIFEAGKKLTEAEEKKEYIFQISGYFDGDTSKKIQHKDVKSAVLDSIIVGREFKKEFPKAVVFGVMYTGKDLNEAKELDNDKYFATKVNVDKLVETLKAPLSTNVKKLNPREKEMFEGFRDIFSRIILLGKYPGECTEVEGEIFEKLGFKVSGKTKEGVETIYTKISK